MKEITLVKKYGPTGIVPIFYKGVGTNLVEITKNGKLPLFLENYEYEEALKRGFGITVKKGIAAVRDVEDKIIPEPVIPAADKTNVVPEPATVVKNDTLIIKDLKKKQESEKILIDDGIQEDVPKVTSKRSRSRKK